MKIIRLVPLIIFLAVSINLMAFEDPIASITFSNPRVENNISFVLNTSSGAEAYTEFTSIGGMDCMHIPGSKYAYFRVNDATIPSDDNLLIVRIKYYDTGYGSIALQYNSIDADYARHSFNQTNSETWATATIALSDASFRNAENNNADFRLTGVSYIRSIEISRGSLNPEGELVPTTTGSSFSELKGKSVAGYQAWFTASPTDAGWVHWSGNERPTVGDFSFEIYPDMRDYDEDERYASDFDDLGNGEPADLFSSAEVIDTHFEWMEETGIDGVALQRFISGVGKVITDVQYSKPILVKQEAEANDRIFYICYDISGTSADWAERIKFDWVFNIEQAYGLTSSPAYATVDDKPVVQIWGPGFTSRLGDAQETIDLIQFLQNRGCYVIGGVPTNWRTESGDSKPNFMAAYKSYDMVSPWTPGRYRDLSGVNNFKNAYIVPDKTFCDANGLDYMPVLFPGFGWSTWQEDGGIPNKIPRIAGEFLWRQAYNIKKAGINQMYFAMFDEYDEGTAIMKAATDWSMIPTNQYFLTLSADGIWVSSDFYLRTAGAATSMLKSTESPSGTIDVPHSLGPVYYRNSFEKRYTEYYEKEVKYSGVYNLDACFYKAAQIEKSNVNNAECVIAKNENNARSGLYLVKASGDPTSSDDASYMYKISEVKIPVVEDLHLSFWKNTINTLGQYVSVDLLFQSGKRLSQLPSYVNNYGKTMDPSLGSGTPGFGWGHTVCKIGEGELLGDVITGIAIAYDHAATGDSYEAYFDDILIASNIEVSIEDAFANQEKALLRIGVRNGTLNFKDFSLNSQVNIYSVSGKLVSRFSLNNIEVNTQFEPGMYLISVESQQGNYTQKVVL